MDLTQAAVCRTVGSHNHVGSYTAFYYALRQAYPHMQLLTAQSMQLREIGQHAGLRAHLLRGQLHCRLTTLVLQWSC